MTTSKKQTGGTWNPDERLAYVFAAGMDRLAGKVDFGLVAVNELESTAQIEATVRFMETAKLLLDSGIFNLTNNHKRAHNISMDEALSLHPDDIDGFDELFDRYVEIVRMWGDKVWGYIELDQGGRERKKETRARLESMGLRPIPVYHPLNDGRDYLFELMEEYDRICFGNIVQANPPLRVRLMHLMHEAKAQFPDVWVHLLGYTPSELALAFPSDSCDSSAWATPSRWPKAHRVSSMMKALRGGVPRSMYIYGTPDYQASDYPLRCRLATNQSVAEFQFLEYSWRSILTDWRNLGYDPLEKVEL